MARYTIEGASYEDTRSGFKGFRYKPIKTKWSNDPQTDLKLKLEFENIATAFQGASRAVAEGIGSATAAVEGLKSALGEDVLVKVNDNDRKAGKLAVKLIAGDGIVFDIQDTNNGLVMVARTTNTPLLIVHDFNTLKYKGEEERMWEEFVHPIPHEYYLFNIYRPVESADTGSVPTWPAGEVRGRHEIAWVSVDVQPKKFRVRFHQPEFGTILLYGSSAIQRW